MTLLTTKGFCQVVEKENTTTQKFFLTQTVRGVVLDADSKTPLIGVQVVLLNSDPLKGNVTNLEGEFKIEKVPVGRVSLHVSYMGYQSQTIPNIVVISGKETVLNLALQEALNQMNAVVVTASDNNNDTLNNAAKEMAIVSANSISPEQTNRYAGGFNDPARILSNFAGVNNSQDGSADIIVRGNSPKYLQWNLEGVQITSPNHFADQSGLGTYGVSALNNNILATSDFYTGAFTAEYGDALSGVYDVKLRAGNNEQFEGIVGLGVVGTDITLEGPFKKDYNGSFIANYRFTTVGLVSKLGLLPDLGGIPEFQDGAFKVVLPTKKMGTFSLFGLGGLSSIKFEDVKTSTWITPGERGFRGDIEEDFEKKSHLFNTGLTHNLPLNTKSYLRTTIAYSNNGIQDGVFERLLEGDTLLLARDNFKSKISNSTYRVNLTYNNKLNAKNTLQIGTKHSLLNQKYNISYFIGDSNDRFTAADFDENIGTIRNFISWKHRINETITLVSGIHNMNILYNNKSTIEPRLAANFKLDNGNFMLGYGMHSTMESVHNYFAKVQNDDGSISEPNKDLDLLKAHHFVLGYEQFFTKNLRGKIELYYQHLYDIPVENSDTSSYSTLNENLDFRYVDLVNKGKGKNYGVEVTLERTFSKNYYFMINASIFESKYTALDKIERNTAFNSNYLVNILFGKDFTKLGKKNNQVFAINGKVFFGGGRKIIPLLRDENGNLDVDTQNNQYYDYSKSYENSLDDIYTITLAFSYKWHKPKVTHELFLNIDNVTNNKPRLSEYYDPSESNSIGHVAPLGIFPNLMYRVYF